MTKRVIEGEQSIRVYDCFSGTGGGNTRNFTELLVFTILCVVILVGDGKEVVNCI